jgi:N-dimethylarginine dimethylaminohydrolase
MSPYESAPNQVVESVPTLPAPWAEQIKDTQAAAQRGEFHVAQIPGYQEGVPPQPSTWHHMDMLDIYPKIYGRECGANGIGKLREVALVEITENERFSLFDEDPMYFPQTGLSYKDLDISKMQDQSSEYQSALEDAGVIVNRVTFPNPPVGAYGPMRGTWAANEVLVLRGGSVIEKIAINPFGNGRSEYLAYWAWTQLGVPPLLTIAGEGVAEAGPCFWLAEDVFVAAHGLAYNEDGLNQLIPAVARSSKLDLEDLNVLKIECAGGRYFYPEAGTSHHPDMVLGPLDARKVIAYPPGIDFTTWSWLKDHDYEIVEVSRDEQLQFSPANVTIIEPGRVIMADGATEAIAGVRKLGVDVVTVPYDQFLRSGGGLHCSTLRVWRDQGPYLTDH